MNECASCRPADSEAVVDALVKTGVTSEVAARVGSDLERLAETAYHAGALPAPLPTGTVRTGSSIEQSRADLERLVCQEVCSTYLVSLHAKPYRGPELRSWGEGFDGIEPWYWKTYPKTNGETRRRVRLVERALSVHYYQPLARDVTHPKDWLDHVPAHVRVLLSSNVYALLDRYVCLTAMHMEEGPARLRPLIVSLPYKVPLGMDANKDEPGHWVWATY